MNERECKFSGSLLGLGLGAGQGVESSSRAVLSQSSAGEPECDLPAVAAHGLCHCHFQQLLFWPGSA